MQINSSEAIGSSSNVNKKSLKSSSPLAEIEAGIKAVAIEEVDVHDDDDDEDQINDQIEKESVQVNLVASELSENKNHNQEQPSDLESKLSDQHQEDIGISDKLEDDDDGGGGKVPTEEEPENGSDDKVEPDVITEDEEEKIQMQKKNEDSLENVTAENVAKVVEEECPECDQANPDNQIPVKPEEVQQLTGSSSSSDRKSEEEEKAEEVVGEEVMEEEQESYPQDLNPFGSDNETKKSSTNPFGSESDSESVGGGEDQEPAENEKAETEIKQKTTELTAPPPPKPPRLSLNPFGSDFEDGSDDDDEVKTGSDIGEEEIKKKARKKRPAPLPPSAVSSKVATSTPQPAPRISLRPPPRYFLILISHKILHFTKKKKLYITGHLRLKVKKIKIIYTVVQ